MSFDIGEAYKEMYPDCFSENGFHKPIKGYTLNEIRTRAVHSNIAPYEVDLTTKIGPVTLPFPGIGAAMDTVSGPRFCGVFAEVGGCGVIYRDKKPEIQLNMIKEALSHKPCLVSNPESVYFKAPLEYAWDILRKHKFSTIPIITKQKILKGMIFTRDIAFRVTGRMQEPVTKWMIPIDKLKTEDVNTPFERIRDRLLNEQDCSVLPVVNKRNRLEGMYFMKDFFQLNPAWFNGNLLVGMAIGVHESDIDRVKEALNYGIGMIVIDSSHGNCTAVIKQTKRVVKLVDDRAAVVAGNIADIDGYCRLAEAGAHAVKNGIGTGAICTTSQVTGTGTPMFNNIREMSYIRDKLKNQGKRAPEIIPDGSIRGPGDMVIALAAGGDACMAGEWFVAAKESLSFERFGLQKGGYLIYRGMASRQAIDERVSDRYGPQKRAPEGEVKLVKYRGRLKDWIGNDIELIQGGFAHCGARNIKELHKYGNQPFNFIVFSGMGQEQFDVKDKAE